MRCTVEIQLATKAQFNNVQVDADGLLTPCAWNDYIFARRAPPEYATSYPTYTQVQLARERLRWSQLYGYSRGISDVADALAIVGALGTWVA